MLRQRPGEGTTLCPAPSLISPWRVLSWLGGRGAKAFKGTATNESFRSPGPNFQGQLHSSGPEGTIGLLVFLLLSSCLYSKHNYLKTP